MFFNSLVKESPKIFLLKRWLDKYSNVCEDEKRMLRFLSESLSFEQGDGHGSPGFTILIKMQTILPWPADSKSSLFMCWNFAIRHTSQNPFLKYQRTTRNKTHFLPDRWRQEISGHHLSFLRWKLLFSFASLCTWNPRDTGRLPSPLYHSNLEVSKWDEVWTQPKWFISQVEYVQRCPTRVSSGAQLLGTSCLIPDPLYTLLHHYYNQRDPG